MMKSINSISHWLNPIFFFFFLVQNIRKEWGFDKNNLLEVMRLKGRKKLQK